jgi:hypothetical protein
MPIDSDNLKWFNSFLVSLGHWKQETSEYLLSINIQRDTEYINVKACQKELYILLMYVCYFIYRHYDNCIC